MTHQLHPVVAGYAEATRVGLDGGGRHRGDHRGIQAVVAEVDLPHAAHRLGGIDHTRDRDRITIRSDELRTYDDLLSSAKACTTSGDRRAAHVVATVGSHEARTNGEKLRERTTNRGHDEHHASTVVAREE